MKRFLLSLLLCCGLHAANYYVATDGTVGGAGTIGDPWSIGVLTNTPSYSAGDTIWLRGGVYGGLFNSHFWLADIDGTEANPIWFRAYTGEVPIIDGSLGTQGEYNYLRDLWVRNSTTNRPSGEYFEGGILVAGKYGKVINCMLETCGHPSIAAYWSGSDVGSLEVYGCISWGTGYHDTGGIGSENGNGLYSQNIGPGYINLEDYISFWQMTDGMKGYSASSAYACNYNVSGLIAFRNGERMIHFATGTTYPHTNINVRNCYTWRAFTTNQMNDWKSLRESFSYRDTDSGNVDLGWNGVNWHTNVNLVFANNYIVGGAGLQAALTAFGWTSLTVTGNTLISCTNRDESYNGQILGLMTNSGAVPTGTWDYNTYRTAGTPSGGLYFAICDDTQSFQPNRKTFTDWKSLTGFDANSTFTDTHPASSVYFVRTNKYERGRFHLVCYNWAESDTMSIPTTGLNLVAGDQVSLYDVQNLKGSPVLQFTYNGSAVNVPQTNTTVMSVVLGPTRDGMHWWDTHTDSRFNVFLGKITGTESVSTTNITNLKGKGKLGGHWRR